MGLRAPSAATEGAITFVIFHQHLQQVVLTEEHTVRIIDYLASSSGGQLPAGPREQERVQPPAIPVEVATKLDHLDSEHGRLRQLVTDTQEQNRLIIIVLFVAALVLLFSLGGLIAVVIFGDSGSGEQAAKIQRIEDRQETIQQQIIKLTPPSHAATKP
jgi:hypothetical protein